jgi:hypothetical protein
VKRLRAEDLSAGFGATCGRSDSDQLGGSYMAFERGPLTWIPLTLVDAPQEQRPPTPRTGSAMPQLSGRPPWGWLHRAVSTNRAQT